MRKIIPMLSIVAAALLLSSCQMDCIRGNGNEDTENRTLNEFSGIDVGGAYNLKLTRNEEQSLTIRADENLLPLIRTEVRDGRLYIYSDEDICDEVEIAINMKDLNHLSASGAVDVESTNRFVTDAFRLDASGAVDVNLEIDAGRINTGLSGAGEIQYRGKAGEHRIEISGAGSLDAFDLVTEKSDINLSGAAACEVHATQELNIHASGAAAVRYRGNPPVVTQDVSGAVSVTSAN